MISDKSKREREMEAKAVLMKTAIANRMKNDKDYQQSKSFDNKTRKTTN